MTANDIGQDLEIVTGEDPVPDLHMPVAEGAGDQDLRTSDEGGPVPVLHVGIGTIDAAPVPAHALRTRGEEREGDQGTGKERETEKETEKETERETGVDADHQEKSRCLAAPIALLLKSPSK